MMNDNLQRAIALIKSGKKKDGRNLLIGILEKDPRNIPAWLWLSSCVNTVEQKAQCLEKVLEIDPTHQVARKALSKLLQLDQPSEQEILGAHIQSANLNNDVPVAKKPNISASNMVKKPSARSNYLIAIGIFISLAFFVVLAGTVILVIKGISDTGIKQPLSPQKQPTRLSPTGTPIPTNTSLPSPTVRPPLLPGPARRYVPVTNDGMPSNYLYPTIDEYKLDDGDYYQIKFEALDGAVVLLDEPAYFFSAFVGDTADNAMKKYREASQSFQVDSNSWKYEWSTNTYHSSSLDEAGQYVGYMGYFGEVGRVFRINNVVVLLVVRIRNLNGITSSNINRIQSDLDKFTGIIIQKFH